MHIDNDGDIMADSVEEIVSFRNSTLCSQCKWDCDFFLKAVARHGMPQSFVFVLECKHLGRVS